MVIFPRLVGEDVEAGSKIGFQVGGTVDYLFNDQWSLLSGLEFTSKGFKFDGDNHFGEDGNNADGYYIQLPIHAGYTFDFSSFNLVVEAGPYLAFGVAGNVAGNNGKYFDDYFAKRFDFGVGAGVGAEFGKFGVKLGYDYGLTNVLQYGDAYNSNLYLTVGYKFRK